MSFTTRAITRDEWDDFVARRAEANFLASWQWGAVHEREGFAVVRRALCRDETVIGAIQAIVRDAKRGRYLEIGGGPLVDWRDEPLAAYCTLQLRQLAKEQGCVFVRVRPQLAATAEHRAFFRRLGFRPAPWHLYAQYTTILTLDRDDETLLAGMRPQTRQRIRQAEKQGVKVSFSSDRAAADEFFAVQQETAKRQGFIPPSKAFLEAQVETFGEHARVYRAEKDGVLLNLAIVMWYGQEADYHEGASTLESRKAPGSYALQWRAIRDARDAGYKRYNFWGIAPNDDPRHRYAGVTEFKRGFGGQDYHYVPAQDLVVQPLAYVKNWAVENIRKKIMRL